MKYDYIVLGAGVAGLAFAYKIAEHGKSVLVLEKENRVGGLSRTFSYRGFMFDLCAHRFHSANETLLREVTEIVGPSFEKHAQRSRIYMFNKYLKYPFELHEVIGAMPPFEAVQAAGSYCLNLLLKRVLEKHIASYKSYKDWFVYHFGHKLYTVMCRPYATKVWKTGPSNISADWADQRFQTPNVTKLMQKTVRKLIRLDLSSYSLEDQALAPDGGEFYHGVTGAHEIPDAFCERIRAMNCPVLTDTQVTAISSRAQRVEYRFMDRQRAACAREAIVSTIPLHACYALGDEEDVRVDAALRDLRYMDIICVYLFLNKEKVSNAHWIYFPDKDVIFNRSAEFKTISREMAPANETALCLDITCFEGDQTWNQTDSDLVAACVDSAERVGLLTKSEVFDSAVVRANCAYPFYDLAYKTKVREVVEFLERDKTLFCLGRTGLFRYNNTDNSIEMGFELAKRLLEKRKESLIDYTIAHVSY